MVNYKHLLNAYLYFWFNIKCLHECDFLKINLFFWGGGDNVHLKNNVNNLIVCIYIKTAHTP